MTLTWTSSQTASFRDAYLDWSILLQDRRDALPPRRPDPGPAFDPLFVRLKDDGQPEDARRALLSAVEATGSALLMDGHERAFLKQRIAAPELWAGLPDEYTVYKRTGTSERDFDHLFRVLDSGVPVHLAPGQAETALPDLPNARKPRDKAQAIVAIVDDGIGFLNARFARRDASGALRTRFEAIWLQALETFDAANRTVLAGRVLSDEDIDAMRDVQEADAYAALNASLYDPGARRSTDFSTSHGTHVLDMAAGADPDDAEDDARGWPLLGVQLPPQALEDTSGTRIESYLIQAVRWCLYNAHQVNPKAPVIVNLSLGIVAGPKDGTRFLEYQVSQEALNWEAATGQPVRIVWAFGNNYRSDLIAEISPDGGATDTLTWRAQPSDRTASYLEIRLPDGQSPNDLEIALTPPGGPESGFVPLAASQYRTLESKGKALARLYHVPARDYGGGVVSPPHYVMALAPSEANKLGEPVVPSGGWQVAVRNTTGAPVKVTLQIQRDDDPGINKALARQSYFDMPGCYAWDPVTHSYTGLANDGPVTHAGSHSALVTNTARPIFSVGGATWNGLAPANIFEPSEYSAEGSDWSVPGPTLATVADQGHFLWGRVGAGTLSGSTRILTGTSIAAGVLTRALALSATFIRANHGKTTTQMDDLDPARVPLVPVPPAMAARLGAALAKPPMPGQLPR